MIGDDAGPTPPGPQTAHSHAPGRGTPSLRASDQDRDHVATLLSHAYAEGRITHDEHDERLDLAMRARTFDDLVPLTEDLVPLDRPLPAPTRQSANLPAVDRAAANHEPDTITAYLGEARRGRHDRVNRNITTKIVMGEAKLDLREAVFDDVEIDIGGLVVMGEIKILVPEGVEVRDRTTTILGETKIKGLDPRPGGPVITLRGTLVMSELQVRGPLAKPFWKLLTGG